MMTIMITITIMMTMTMTMTITITIMLTITVTVTIMMTITITITITIMMTMTITISNGNRTEWSPIRSVIIRVISKIGQPRSGSPICLITSMITNRIGRHEVLLPINHNFNKICDIIGYF